MAPTWPEEIIIDWAIKFWGEGRVLLLYLCVRDRDDGMRVTKADIWPQHRAAVVSVSARERCVNVCHKDFVVTHACVFGER
jgi:hypothetical protein